MASQTWYGNSAGSKLTLSYDSVYSNGTEAVLVNPKVTFQSNSGWLDSVNSGSCSGGAVVDGALWSNFNFNGGTDTFTPTAEAVALTYGSPTNANFTVTVAGISFFNGDGATTNYTLSCQFPARPYSLPLPPIGFTGSRVSDNRVNLSWQANYTGGDGPTPWEGLRLDRWDNVTNGWYRIATLHWGATSYADTTTTSDRRYHYALYAYNDAGESDHVHLTDLYTTPASHTNLQWSKATADVVLTWAKASTLTVTTEVQESAGGGAWTTKATVAAGTNTWTHTTPDPAASHQYRVRPVAASLTGAYTTSTVVQLLAAPLAPTALAPASVTVDPNDGSVAITWQHNPGDGTSQTAYEHQFKESGGAYTSSGKITSTSSARTITTMVRGKTYVHQVRTWGQHATASPWSVEQSFTTGARPQSLVTYPTAADHGASALTMAWTFYDLEAGAHASSQIELLSGTTVVYSATLPGATTSHTLDYELANLTTYKARSRVLDPTGLWSPWSEVTFATDFVPPTTPTVVGSFDANLGTITLSIANPDADGTTTVWPVSNTIYRSVDGVEELVAEGLPVNATVTDHAPVTSGTNTYRVVAWSATPTSAEATPLVMAVTSPWVFINGGPGNATMARLKGGPAVQLAAGRPKVLHQFVGRTFPLEFTGKARTRAYSVSGVVDGFGAEADAWGSWTAWEAIADLPAPLVFRDPLGRREHVSISDVTVDHDAASRKAKVSATLTVVDRG